MGPIYRALSHFLSLKRNQPRYFTIDCHKSDPDLPITKTAIKRTYCYASSFIFAVFFVLGSSSIPPPSVHQCGFFKVQLVHLGIGASDICASASPQCAIFGTNLTYPSFTVLIFLCLFLSPSLSHTRTLMF